MNFSLSFFFPDLPGDALISLKHRARLGLSPRHPKNTPCSSGQQQSPRGPAGSAAGPRRAAPSCSHPVFLLRFSELFAPSPSSRTHSIWQDAVSNLFWLSLPFVLTVYGSFSITCGELAKPRDERNTAMQLAAGTRGREDGPKRSCCSPAPNIHSEAIGEKLPLATQGLWAPIPKETVVAVSPQCNL